MTATAERQLRELFAAEAAAAPHDADLVAGALRKVRRRRHVQLAGAGLTGAVLVVGAVVASSGAGPVRPTPPAAVSPPSRPATPSSASDPPAAGGVGPLRGNTSADCVESYSPKAAVTRRAFAFDGTVTAIGPVRNDLPGGLPPRVAVTFRVHTWFRGGSGQTVTVDMEPPAVLNPDSAVTSYGVGTRLLVAGDPRWGGAPLDAAVAWGCGFTRYYDPQTAAEWAAAAG